MSELYRWLAELGLEQYEPAFADNDRNERKEENNKLGAEDIAQTILSIVMMRDKGFVPEVTVWATNPF